MGSQPEDEGPDPVRDTGNGEPLPEMIEDLRPVRGPGGRSPGGLKLRIPPHGLCPGKKMKVEVRDRFPETQDIDFPDLRKRQDFPDGPALESRQFPLFLPVERPRILHMA